ncbi:MAG: 50S ribosomal protein L14 [Parcubacteria group bacterium GW2011_GWB1_45_7]|uniref:Large ribosomal subunit protein uL14 n=4 Tax=Parcubacteria group TaxID=1794811 RepID=A0A0H4TEZ6_9BACT|nr:ribosomal protein L14 [uncultured Parcubacteria bacterium Rifle_16ft_4_minimus_37647]AKQ05590.1 ribosomal protein L14 [uncultured Parcubacteria bacterium Rifle_16ft_4_minimus_23790]KKU11938.1 MAG: 50S ribosomal protein L14 [Parcubacteria group bacterium GW2011_GWB1_45_7]OGY58606.1 MAG: 50S ribosomal protein L14 [Candidatus Colwellbacteria bacterium RIFCSPHIGHO2_02_FULL_45_17]OGY61701.1 MAG: 50S ribosomal protein L14 [Candidatus Colwellbacteria bacterium RIFCSPLOWO2_02_FULL_45_11]OGY62727.1 
MIQEQTILKVADNSGAKVIRCFRILGGTRRRYARVGDLIVASVQSAEPRKQVKKKEIVRAVIVRSRDAIRRKDGSYVRFDENAAVLVDAKKLPRATRIFGPIPRELKERGYDKIVSLAQDVV